MRCWGELKSFRPHPHVSGDFCIRKLFYADTPSVHTCPPYTLDVSGDFCIRSPEWKFLHTLWSGYVWTLVSVYFCICWRHSVRTSLFPREIWLILWDVRMRIRYVWTVVYDSYTLHVDADIFVSAEKNLRIQKSPDTCGRGLIAYCFYDLLVAVRVVGS